LYTVKRDVIIFDEHWVGIWLQKEQCCHTANYTVLRECKPPPKCCGFITLFASVICPSVMKSAGDCMRNANKSPKITYSVKVREVQKTSALESVSVTRSLLQINQFC